MKFGPVALAMTAALAAGVGSFAQAGPALQEPGRIIIKFKSDHLPPGLDMAAERANLEKAQGLNRLLTISGINAQVYTVSDKDTGAEVVRRILASKKHLIEYAEIDALATPAYQPNDPYFYATSSWHLQKIGAPAAWDSVKGEGVTVAVLDSGVDCSHTELSANCVAGWNVASNNTDTADIHGHGTMVATTLGSVGDNAQGGIGVASRSKIMPIRLTNDSSNSGVPCSNIASGIVWAADHGAKVASNSYEIYGCSVVVDAANYMASKGGVYVRSAGNSNIEVTTVNDANVIVTSATNQNDAKTSWSNYGSIVDVSAPGIDVYCSRYSGAYGTCWGTSFATPITAGVLAMMFTVHPGLTPDQAKSALFSTATDLGVTGWDKYFGHGRINAASAVAKALAIKTTVDATAPSVPGTLAATAVSDAAVSLSWTPSTDNVLVTGYHVYRNGQKIGTASSASITDSALTANTTYSYTVAAFDGAGNVSAQSSPLSVTTKSIAFNVSSYSVTNKTSNSATIGVSLTTAGTVTVRYGTSSSNLNFAAQSSTLSTAHSVLLGGLSAGTTYYYRVEAKSQAGQTVLTPVSSFLTSRQSSTGGKRK